MTEQRLALPQRSPYPLTQPCTWVAPASTAASVLATATSESLWVWMPRMPSKTLAHLGEDLDQAPGECAAVGIA
jgi:hypothetical protein